MHNKYIGTKEAASLTGRPYDEILNLAKTGVLPCHRTRRGHYRLNVDAVEKYFGIQINKTEDVEDKPTKEEKAIPTSDTRLITESHYEEVIEQICAAKSSIRIMTGDFKRFRLKPTENQGRDYNDGTPFIERLMEKAVQGACVSICPLTYLAIALLS